MSFVHLSLGDPEEQRTPGRDLPPSDYPLVLGLPTEKRTPQRWASIIAASVLFHLVTFWVALNVPILVERLEPHRVATPAPRHVPLYLPRELMTQKAPNKEKPSKQIDLASLLAEQQQQQRERASPAPTVRRFELPKNAAGPQTSKTAPRILAEAPNLQLNPNAPATGAGALNGLPPAPPPPSSKPSELETAGAQAPPSPTPKIAPQPKAPLPSTIHEPAQGAGQRTAVSDDTESLPAPEVPGLETQIGSHHARIELESDAQGADFRDYLRRILARIRANQTRTSPGKLRGRTVIEVVINRDGSIPTSVISRPSGLTQLDLAAMAALSMSNPLPNLPDDYRGMQVRLTLTFSYNMPTQ